MVYKKVNQEQEKRALPNSIVWVNFALPEARVTLSTAQVTEVLLFTRLVIRLPLYCFLFTEPKLSLPWIDDFRLRVKTGS